MLSQTIALILPISFFECYVKGLCPSPNPRVNFCFPMHLPLVPYLSLSLQNTHVGAAPHYFSTQQNAAPIDGRLTTPRFLSTPAKLEGKSKTPTQCSILKIFKYSFRWRQRRSILRRLPYALYMHKYREKNCGIKYKIYIYSLSVLETQYFLRSCGLGCGSNGHYYQVQNFVCSITRPLYAVRIDRSGLCLVDAIKVGTIPVTCIEPPS